MSKIAYLLGAGASFGERNPVKRDIIDRGLPVINEIPHAIDQLLIKLGRNLENEKKDPLIKDLLWLREKCLQYPTIDTYAKILYVNGTGVNQEYLHLKRILALFFLLFQDRSKRDLRYDNFIASLIGSNKELPPIDILTWNYDAQLEFAFSEYFQGLNVEALWKRVLNVCNKTYFQHYMRTDSSFSITKLNGTAFFEQNNSQGFTHVLDWLLTDMSLAERSAKAKEILAAEYNANDLSLPQSGISYVWENGLDKDFFPDIERRISDAEVLVVIGYSFPYVNRPTDKRLLGAMKNLKKVYIQDKSPQSVSDVLATLCSVKEENFIHVSSLGQFIIPYELEL